MHILVQEFNKKLIAQANKEIPDFRAGDTLRVHQIIKEGAKSRKQIFQGICIRIQGASYSKTFTVRKITGGYKVEKTWPIYAPAVETIEVIRRGKVRRSKLYFLRKRKGKSFKIKELKPTTNK